MDRVREKENTKIPGQGFFRTENRGGLKKNLDFSSLVASISLAFMIIVIKGRIFGRSIVLIGPDKYGTIALLY